MSNKRALICIGILSLLVVSCGAQDIGTDNWAGMTVDGDVVYVAYGPGVLALDVADQTRLWQYPSEATAVKFYAPPDISEGRLAIGDYGENQGTFKPGVSATVYMLGNLDQGTPTEVWTSKGVARDRLVAPPLQADGKVFVGTADNQFLALSAANGSQVWPDPVALGHSVWGQPSFADGKVLVASMDRAVRALDPDNGNEIWSAEFGGAIAAKPLVIDGLVYIASFDSAIHALDLETGQEVWQTATEGWLWNTPAVVNDTLIIGDQDGNVYALAADSGDIVWQTTVAGSIAGGVAADDTTVYVPLIVEQEDSTALSGGLVALAADTGNSQWQIDMPGAMQTTPVIAAGQVVTAYKVDNELIIEVVDPNGTKVWTYRPTEDEG